MQTFLKTMVNSVRQAYIWKDEEQSARTMYAVVFKGFKTQIADDYWTDSLEDAEDIAERWINKGKLPE